MIFILLQTAYMFRCNMLSLLQDLCSTGEKHANKPLSKFLQHIEEIHTYNILWCHTLNNFIAAS